MNPYIFKLANYLENLSIKKSEIDELCNLFRIHIYDKGEHFAYEGGISNKLGFLIDGVFHMYIIDDNGNKYSKNFITENQFLLATFNPQEKNEVSLEALSKAIVLEAIYTDVLALYKKYPYLSDIARKGMESRFISLHQRYDDFANKDAKERYLLFKSKFGKKEKLIPQYLIASYLGITPTQLSRIRKS